MRTDLIFPLLLAAALAGIVIYAASGSQPQAALKHTPIGCAHDAVMASLHELPEASGLAASERDKQLFWSHNDSAEPYVFALSTDGKVRARVRLSGASVVDWEAVTTGGCTDGTCLFVGDIGDNERRRASIRVYVTPEPAPGDRATRDVRVLEAVYPDGPQDAEAMFVADGQLFIVTKGEGTPVRLYRLPSVADSPQTLELVTTLIDRAPDRSWRVTDAAMSPDGRWVAMRSNDLVLFFECTALLSGRPTAPLSFDLRKLREPQGEGLAWSDARTLFLAGEDEGGGTFARISCNLPG